MNLDPYKTKTDEEIWAVLEQSNLKNFVKSLPGSLDFVCAEGGDNVRWVVCSYGNGGSYLERRQKGVLKSMTINWIFNTASHWLAEHCAASQAETILGSHYEFQF